MKFGSSWIVKAPCKVNGVECTERSIGCRDTCEKWEDYQVKFKAFKENMCKQKTREDFMGRYLAETKARYLGKKHER